MPIHTVQARSSTPLGLRIAVAAYALQIQDLPFIGNQVALQRLF
jgi:hypothetical protein